MATYFDPTDEDHRNLLPQGQRKSNEVAVVSVQAEADVIRMYTKRAPLVSRLGFPSLGAVVNTDLGHVVFLHGYKQDADDADTDPDLKQALLETIAGVVSWRITRQNKDKAIVTESTDVGKTITWSSHGAASFPPQFDWRLELYDLREPVWAL